MTFKNKYKEEFNDIRFADRFEENTINLLSRAAERKENIIMINKRNPLKIAAFAVAAIMLLSFSAYAIVSLMSASEVADHFGEKELAVLFEKNNFEPQTVKGDVYSVTFMGIAPGEEFYAYEIDAELISENRTYAVIAVYRNDDEPLTPLEESPVQVTPVMDGYKTTALVSLGMSHQRFSKDGVLYYLYDYTDLEIFADKNVRLMAFEGTSPFSALTTNETGEIVYAEDYNGFKGMFELSLDESKADPRLAEKLLNDSLR